jgi:aryl-alcohol dehydrogenase-like predicted oxidoreductase
MEVSAICFGTWQFGGEWARRTSARTRARYAPLTGDTVRANVERVRDLARFAEEEKGCSVGELAIAWTLSHPAVHVAIVGARRPDHIEGMAGAANLSLSRDERAEVERIMEGMVAAAGPSPEM